MSYKFSDKYRIKFADASELLIAERVFPEGLIGRWEGLIEEIKQGYNWVPPELENDLDGSRGRIEPFLFNSSLNAFQEHRFFIKTVADLDRQFIELT